MRSDYIALIHYRREHARWLHLAGWDAPPTARDARDALRQIEEQTDVVIAERGEPEHAPFVLLAGSLSSEHSPHVVRKWWRLAPDLADRLLRGVEGRGADEAIDEALAEWEREQARAGEPVEPLDTNDYVGLDFDDLARRAHPPEA